MWQFDLVYTIESVLPVCDKPYHMNNGCQQIVEPCIVLQLREKRVKENEEI